MFQFLLFLPENIADSDVPVAPTHCEWSIQRKQTFDADSLMRCNFLLSFGDVNQWLFLSELGRIFRFRWVHYETTDILHDGDQLIRLFLHNRLRLENKKTSEPLISVITSTYCSGNKIERPLESLKGQTYDYWEWIIWDDSPSQHSETYDRLLEIAKTDRRVRVYRSHQHSGVIGEVKQRACGLARGEWIVELDHDDRMHPNLFKWIHDIHFKHPTANFIYSDCIELHENNDEPFSYGHFFGLGYGSYIQQRVKPSKNASDAYHFVIQTPPVNPITLSHIVGIPNHVRVWKRTFYELIGKHSEDLPVADDYELFLRTFLACSSNEPQMVRIVYPAYYQYRNKGGNNFTFLRNALIQKLVFHIYSLYRDAIIKKCKQIGWDESRYHTRLSKPLWENDDPSHFHFKPIECSFVPEDQDPTQPCISVVCAVEDIHTFQQSIQSLFNQSYKRWILFVIGIDQPKLHSIMDAYHDDRVRFYNLPANDTTSTSIKFAVYMIVQTRFLMFLNPSDAWDQYHMESIVPMLIDDEYSSIIEKGGVRVFRREHLVYRPQDDIVWQHIVAL